MNLLEAVRRLEIPCPIVVVTSDKCYAPKIEPHNEDDALGGPDPYSMSKGVSELIVRSWKKSFFDSNDKLGPIATVRAGNVIGGGDYASYRIVPDCIRSLINKEAISVRNPNSIRPWQHVFDCLNGYLIVGAKLLEEGKQSIVASAFNFGPDSVHTVRELVESILRQWPGTWIDASKPSTAEDVTLLLATEKARTVLDWQPQYSFDESVKETVEWYYQRHGKGANMLHYSIGQLERFRSASMASARTFKRQLYI
jgi:CDP-glucose 4,6-dehydratase